MKYLVYLKELRNRLLISFMFLIICFFFFFLNINFVINLLIDPLYEILGQPENRRMIFTGLLEVVVSNLKVALFASFLIPNTIFLLFKLFYLQPQLYIKRKKNFF